MIEPSSAIGLASSIVQLLSFAGDVITETLTFLESTSKVLPSNEAVTKLTRDQKTVTDRIVSHRRESKPANDSEQAVRDGADRCSNEARLLLLQLEALTPKSSSNKLKAGLDALHKTVVSRAQRKSVASQQQKLHQSQALLSTALLNLIWQNQDTQFDQLKSWIKLRGVNDGDQLLDLSDQLRTYVEEERLHRHDSARMIDSGFARQAERQEQNDATLIRAVTTGTNATQRSIAALETSTTAEQKAQKLVQSLRFSQMQYRRDDIPEAHKETFKWCSDSKASPFPDWLEKDSDLFWICGKAGSGKSTLMKFMSKDEKSWKYLRTWSQDRTLVFAHHYFWCLGTAMQKSLSGLLHSMLCQILASDSQGELCKVLCEGRWNGQAGDLSRTWSNVELMDALQNVERCDDIKVCVFVDGLDECQPHDDHSALVTALETLAKMPNMKICVSSRPWTTFSNAFGDLKNRMLIEELTKTDIASYVKDELQDAMKNIVSKVAHQSDLNDLADQVTRRAEGVFFWVRLVVAALKERLEVDDDVEALQHCVDDFPDKLEDYFRDYIYDRINKTWRKDTAQALKMAILVAQQHEELSQPQQVNGKDKRYSYDFTCAKTFLPFWLLKNGISSADFACARETEIKFVSKSQLHEMAMDTKKRLNACCKDLLGFTEHHTGRKGDVCRCRVEFLHRTVYDYLLESEAINNMLNEKAPSFFQDDGFLFNVWLGCFKVAPEDLDSGDEDLCQDFAEISLFNLLKLEVSMQDANRDRFLAAMRELDYVGAQYLYKFRNEDFTKHYVEAERDTLAMLLQRLISHHFHQYVQQVAAKMPDVFRAEKHPTLLSALGLCKNSSFPLDKINERLVNLLLEHGADPNQASAEYARDSIWAHFLRRWFQETTGASSIADCTNNHPGEISSLDHPIPNPTAVWNIAKLLIEHRARLKVKICLRGDSCTCKDEEREQEHREVADVLRGCVPTELQDDLEKTLQVYENFQAEGNHDNKPENGLQANRKRSSVMKQTKTTAW